MNSGQRSLLISILLIVVGAGWLLSALGVIPQINWIWTLGLGAVGVGMFALLGVDKFTIVVGTFFIVASVLSLLRQTGQLSIDVELPILVISAGVLLLVARRPSVPTPPWILEAENKRR